MANGDEEGLRGAFAGPAMTEEERRRRELDLVGDDPGAQEGRTVIRPTITQERMDIVDAQRRGATLPGFRDTRPSNIGDIGGIAEYELAEWMRDIPSWRESQADFGEGYDIDPYVEMAGSAKAADAYADKHAWAAAQESLGAFQEMADLGFSEQEFAAMDAMEQRQETALRGGEMAQFEQMEAMGIGGAGLEGVQALNAAQSQAQQAAMQDIETAAAVEERKRYGTMAAGQLGADMAAQSFGQDYMRGQARDIAARAQADMMQGYQEKRAKDREQEALANIDLTQRRFGQQAQGTGMMGSQYTIGRGEGTQASSLLAAQQMAVPHEPSGWSQGLGVLGGLGGTVLDLYKQSEADEAKADKEAEDATGHVVS